MIHLDTSFLVDVLRESGRNHEGPARRFLTTIEGEEPAISVFVACELFAGAEHSRRVFGEMQRVEQICATLRVEYPDQRFAPVYARLLETLLRAGRGISTMDLLIATAAVLAEAPLVTGNVRHFARVPGLRILTY